MSSKRDRPLNSSRSTSGVHQSPTRSVARAIGHGQSSKRVRRTYDPATGTLDPLEAGRHVLVPRRAGEPVAVVARR